MLPLPSVSNYAKISNSYLNSRFYSTPKTSLMTLSDFLLYSLAFSALPFDPFILIKLKSPTHPQSQVKYKHPCHLVQYNNLTEFAGGRRIFISALQSSSGMKGTNRSPAQFETCPIKELDITERTRQQKILKMPKKRVTRYNRQHLDSTRTLTDQQNPNDNQIHFEPKASLPESSTPGVGEYDIASSIIKPTYETYDKGNNIILVKLNHIGGTASFRSEEERFADQQTFTPGPGSYNTITTQPVSSKRPQKETHSDNYDIIQEILRSKREVSESIPNYKLDKLEEMQYNGMPRHLQQMYHQLSKPREIPKCAPSLQLDRLIKIRKRAERMSIRMGKSTDLQDEESKDRITKRHWESRYEPNVKMTQTLYKLQNDRKKETERIKKIEAILEGRSKHKSVSFGRQLIIGQRKGEQLRQKYNQNMVNMIFQQNRGLSKRQTTNAEAF